MHVTIGPLTADDAEASPGRTGQSLGAGSSSRAGVRGRSGGPGDVRLRRDRGPGLSAARASLTVMTFASAMVLFAHPDDAEFMCGGTVAGWAREGCEVHYVVCTDGSAGSNEPGVTREQMRADPRAGAARRRRRARREERHVPRRARRDARGHARHAPQGRAARSAACGPRCSWRPTRAGSGRRAATSTTGTTRPAGQLALSAVMPDAPTRLMFPELLDEGLEPYEIPNLWLSSEDEPTPTSTSPTRSTRSSSALSQHVSQEAEAAAPWVRERARERGRTGGVRVRRGVQGVPIR